MFANINLKGFPLVNVDLFDIEKPSDFYDFLNFWEKLHDKKQEYIFLFNTENMSMPSLSYATKISEFIKKMKYNIAMNPIIIYMKQRVDELIAQGEADDK